MDGLRRLVTTRVVRSRRNIWRTGWKADAPDLQGFGLPLPAGADLFFQRVVGASVEFGRSGETVIEIGGAETRLRSAMIEAFMIALCRSAGAAGAWSGAFREDHIHEHLLTLDAAMEAREPGASLPFSRIAEPASEMCVWQGTVGADLAPTSVDGMLGVWQKRA